MSTIENALNLSTGIYTYPDIAHVLDMPYHKVQRWLQQYWEGALGKEFNRNYTWNVDGTKAVSFHTMIELFTFFELNKAGVTPKRILEAHKELSALYKTPFPFATRSILQGLQSDGKMVLLKRKDDSVLSLNGTKQFNMAFVLEFVKKLEFRDDLVHRFWPLGKNVDVVCDPAHQFGHAVILGTNILPEVVANMHRAGDSIKLIAASYDLKLKQVKDAIAYSDRGTKLAA